jgi:hypothetical protein
VDPAFLMKKNVTALSMRAGREGRRLSHAHWPPTNSSADAYEFVQKFRKKSPLHETWSRPWPVKELCCPEFGRLLAQKPPTVV